MVVIVLLALVVAGCSGGGPAGDDDGSLPDEGPPVVLRGDGIGAHRFGAAVDEVIVGLTLRWGPPDGDSGWLPAEPSPFGVCPGGEVRVVEWRGFDVRFSDGPTPHGSAGRRHFFAWAYRAADPHAPAPDPGGNRPPLATAAGVSVGSTVADLREAYGTGVEVTDRPRGRGPGGAPPVDGGAAFAAAARGGEVRGSVTSAAPAGRVASLAGGAGCDG